MSDNICDRVIENKVMGRWQPIETAPNDGTKILVYQSDNPAPYVTSQKDGQWDIKPIERVDRLVGWCKYFRYEQLEE